MKHQLACLAGVSVLRLRRLRAGRAAPTGQHAKVTNLLLPRQCLRLSEAWLEAPQLAGCAGVRRAKQSGRYINHQGAHEGAARYRSAGAQCPHVRRQLLCSAGQAPAGSEGAQHCLGNAPPLCAWLTVRVSILRGIAG
eukprot:scaffold11107_cov115-Isochrysis_galbana.AAC.5